MVSLNKIVKSMRRLLQILTKIQWGGGGGVIPTLIDEIGDKTIGMMTTMQTKI
ncbi:MAG: hypothetical protein LBG04_00440 [Holosporaceae bacterium]|nr:hypothetical protein [Holosporaceae bacterium]